MLYKLYRIRWQALVLLILLFLIISGAVIGSATANIMPATYASESNYSVTANQLKPVECSGIDLTNIVDVSQGDTFTAGNDLVLGTSGNDTPLRGGQGDDCIIGGDGNDRLRGNRGNDILLGGNGDDLLHGGIGNDICYGNAGNNTFLLCESIP